MARQSKRLKALSVGRLKEPGLYPDGDGLYLQVTGTGDEVKRSWIYRYRLGGRKTPRDMGLGPYPDVSLENAREAAAKARELCRGGVDPIDARRAARAQDALEKAKAITFKECAEAYIKAHTPGWRNAKHGDQWRATLDTYADPVIGKLAVQAVDTGLVMKVLEPIWKEKTETASRLRGRIEAILDWATVRGLRQGDNPARWRGRLDNLLPARAKVQKVKHHAALPYQEIGAFMEALRGQDGIAASALEYLILTATRTSETIGATWDEVNLEDALWVIPEGRIKAGKAHRVPLSAAALAILERTPKKRRTGPLFPNERNGDPLSTNALLKLLKRMGRSDLTAHGFRSTFRDWAAERTNYPREVAEMALAHTISDKVEAAYRRGDLFEKRKRLMAEWAKFCATAIPTGEVVSLKVKKKKN